MSTVRKKDDLYEELYKPTLSASLIGARPDGTRFNGVLANRAWAFILRVDPKAIIASLSQDSGQNANTSQRAYSEALVSSYRSYYGLHTPDSLLKESIESRELSPDTSTYNEIFLATRKGVEFVGIVNFVGQASTMYEPRFFKNPSNPKIVDENQKLKVLTQISEDLDIPIVSVFPD